MTRKRRRQQTPSVSDPSSRYRKIIRYIEPKVFYEDNYFSPHGDSANSWRLCWLAEKGVLALFLTAAWFEVWWLLPLLFFPLSLFWIVRASIEGKAGNGYPELEVGDAMGIALVGFMSGIVSLIWWFWAVF